MNMLAAMELPSSVVAIVLASTKLTWSEPAAADDGALDARGGQREIGVAGEIARQELGGVDDETGRAAAHGGEHLLGAGDDEVAAEHEIGIARRDPDRVDVLLALREAHMAVDRAALLGEAGHVDHAAALVLEMGRHAENRADGDDARAADAGHDDRVRSAW